MAQGSTDYGLVVESDRCGSPLGSQTPLSAGISPRAVEKILSWLSIGVVFGICAAALGLHIRHYFPYISDDAFISLRYSRRLAAGHGLTWTDGERVEGYTNLLWVLLHAPAAALGLDPLVSARVWGSVGILGALVAIGFSPQTGRLGSGRLLAGGMLLVTSTPIAVWAIGGLEQGLLAGAVAVALAALARATCTGCSARSVAVGAAALTAVALLRADGVVLVVTLLAVPALVGFPNGTRLDGLRRFGAPAVAAFGAQLVFRLAYYGEWWPNSAVAKVAFTAERLERGLAYVQAGATSFPVVLALAVCGTALALNRKPRGRLALAWLLIATWTAFVLLVGGDIFPAYRQLVVVLIPLTWLVAEGAESFLALVGRRSALVALSLVPLVAWHVKLQREDPASKHAHDDNWEFDGLAIGELLGAAFAKERPLFAMDAAGALAYGANLPAIDLLGLNDRHIGRQRTALFGHGAPGHELGDGKYVFARRPDLVSFGCGGGTHAPVFISGHELLAIPEFKQEYQWIRLDSGPPRNAYGEVWVRREGGRVGLERAPGRVVVPGYLFTGEASAATSKLTHGSLAAHLTEANPGRFTGLALERGRWRLRVAAEGPPGTVSLRCGAAERPLTAPTPELVLELATPTRLEIVVAPGHAQAGPLVLRELVFTRDPSAPATLACPPDPAAAPR